MLGFGSPGHSLGDMDAEAASRLITAAADVAFVMDGAGVIRDMAFGSEDLATASGGRRSWLDRTLLDSAAEDSRAKVTDMLDEAARGGSSRWRHLNLRTGEGITLPVMCSASRVGSRTVIFGRDLRQLASLQQRLVEAQQAMEREYARLRQAETRYRLLFQMTAEPVLVLDATTLRVLEANLAADRIFGAEPSFLAAFAEADRARVDALLAAVRSAGQAEERRALLAASGRAVLVSASLLRQERASLFLVRLSYIQPEAPPESAEVQARLAEFVESTPDAFVLTDETGRILTANPAFIDLAQLPTEAAALNQPLSRFLGRQAVEMEVLMAQVRGRGPVRLFRTALRGDHGTEAEVEVSATPVVDHGEPCFGFTIRDVGPRAATAAPPGADLPAAAGQLTELVGRVPLKELVREATDVIEKLAIEAALELTKDNRASAAEMLGLSRQSLYVKLRRYGIGDPGPEEEN
ncbi:MAG: transcriptional regulator PpsR [Acetobacteraceae bacterium]|nr:transcriptional regulator PpsR [Acetobacteraceae bacterium]